MRSPGQIVSSGLEGTISVDCNFLSRLDNLDENSESVGRFEERSFNICQFNIDRRVVKRRVVHRTSDSGFEDRRSGCGLSFYDPEGKSYSNLTINDRG
jgi:hypothetical protein